MHVSLDSALGRQRRLNSVGESVLQIAPNAAAAYSLRSLTGGSPKVVRVRRASDNGERDFTSAEINSGEMVSWVNRQVVAPLDIQELEADGRTGDFLIAKAAYSLRSLGTRQATLAATGDTVARADGKFVAQVRRSSDDALKSFTAAEITDGTLLAFVNLDDAYKGKAFLNNNSNAKVTFSSSYAMLASNNWSIKFTMILGKEGGAGFGILGDTINNSLFVGSNRRSMAFTDAAGNFVNITPTVADPNAGQPIQVELFNTVGSGVAVKFDGVTVSSASAVGDFTFNTLGTARTRIQERVIFDLEIDLNGDGTVDHKYAGDGNQNSNWVDQKGNSNGTVSGAVTDYNNEFTDGHVKTWYDQSVTNEAGDTATGNHATQATAASQPKIVSAGALETDSSGNPALVGDGTDDTLFNSTLTTELDNSDFLITAAYKDEVALGITGAVPRLYLRQISMSYDTINTITYSAQTGRKILSFQVVGDTQEVFGNGTSLGTASQAQANIGQSLFGVMQALSLIHI